MHWWKDISHGVFILILYSIPLHGCITLFVFIKSIIDVYLCCPILDYYKQYFYQHTCISHPIKFFKSISQGYPRRGIVAS